MFSRGFWLYSTRFCKIWFPKSRTSLINRVIQNHFIKVLNISTLKNINILKFWSSLWAKINPFIFHWNCRPSLLGTILVIRLVTISDLVFKKMLMEIKTKPKFETSQKYSHYVFSFSFSPFETNMVPKYMNVSFDFVCFLIIHYFVHVSTILSQLFYIYPSFFSRKLKTKNEMIGLFMINLLCKEEIDGLVKRHRLFLI